MSRLAGRTGRGTLGRIQLLFLGLLQLSELERALLEAAYIVTVSGPALPDVAAVDESARWRALVAALGQPVALGHNAVWVTAAQRLRGLALLKPRRYRADSCHWLSDDLTCYPALAGALEARHNSHAHLLNALLLPLLDLWDYDPNFAHSKSANYLVRVPPAIEHGYQLFEANKPLSATHLKAFIQWWCDWSVVASDLKWLMGG